MKEVLLKMMIDATNKYENAGYRLNGPMNYKSDGFIEGCRFQKGNGLYKPMDGLCIWNAGHGALNAIRMGVEEVGLARQTKARTR